ncbi:DUF6516 family protein [Tepidimonas taiwanensis]|uniref:Uncharacterized protein n=1 Tax=Tepidimonas taiwanensis TaxID=307486 RepID=A0A554X0D0_9BURK|nr:DUF6516 family protein [Tepidimonas taiwanensis]TSE29274.1 hypothetical protein Ttaiw_02347 [Tepidimonas taiwanensis]UBQ06160.1 DUF6516 family protein [Tepidimonas taiwanensis]
MAERKVIDERIVTRGGGVIRIEAWEIGRGEIVRYNMAYVNPAISRRDNGRLVGHDNSHRYAGFASEHHHHWFGCVAHNGRFRSFEEELSRFELSLKRLKRRLGKEY